MHLFHLSISAVPVSDTPYFKLKEEYVNMLSYCRSGDTLGTLTLFYLIGMGNRDDLFMFLKSLWLLIQCVSNSLR